MQSYVGVTGFTEAAQVTRALQAVPERSTRKFMVGVLASAKSLRGIPLKPEWRDRYPKETAIRSIFPDDPRTLNLVHYAPGDEYRASFLHDLFDLSATVGSRLHGFQLNMAWPRETELGVYREDRGYLNHVIVLQLGAAAIDLLDGWPTAVAKRVRQYGALVDAVLVDASGGRGEPLNLGNARAIVSEIVARNPRLGIGVAGGLDAEAMDRVAALVEEFPQLSVDAEGRLRNADGLNDHAVTAYLRQAYATLDRVPYALPA